MFNLIAYLLEISKQLDNLTKHIFHIPLLHISKMLWSLPRTDMLLWCWGNHLFHQTHFCVLLLCCKTSWIKRDSVRMHGIICWFTQTKIHQEKNRATLF